MLKPGLRNVSTKKAKMNTTSKSKSCSSNMISTPRPSCSSQRCQFRLSIFCDRSDEKWYLSYSSDEHPGYHCGHFQLPTNAINTPLQYMSDENKKTLMSCVKSNVSYSACARVVNSTNTWSVSFDKNQMRYLAGTLRSSDDSKQLLWISKKSFKYWTICKIISPHDKS